MTGHKEIGTETKKEIRFYKGTGSEVKTKRSNYSTTKTKRETVSVKDGGTEKEIEGESCLLPISAPHPRTFTHLPLHSYLTSPRVL